MYVHSVPPIWKKNNIKEKKVNEFMGNAYLYYTQTQYDDEGERDGDVGDFTSY